MGNLAITGIWEIINKSYIRGISLTCDIGIIWQILPGKNLII